MASTEVEAKCSPSGSKIPAAMEVPEPSSRLTEQEIKDEEQGGSSLTSAAASAFSSDSSLCSRGGGNNDDAEDVEKEHMFDKVVTRSDVGKLNRLVIPAQHAEKYFPLDASAKAKRGLLLSFEDDSDGKQWHFRYSFWSSSQSYVMTKGWGRFVKEKRLGAGDTVSFSRGRGRLFIDCKRRADSGDPHRRSMPGAGLALALPTSPVAGLWAGGSAGGFVVPPATLFNEHHRFPQDLNAPAPSGQLDFFHAAGRPMLPPPQPSPAVTAGRPMVLDLLPLVKSPTAAAAAKRMRLFDVNIGDATGSSAAAVHKDRAQDTGNELLMSQYHNTVESSQFRRTGPCGGFFSCVHVVQFVVRIKARVRLSQARKTYPTHGSAATEKLRVTPDRLHIKVTGKGTGFRGSSDLEAWTKDLESDSPKVTKVVKRQILDENVRRSTFTEEDSFYPRHKHLYSKERVDKLHFNFCKDVEAWITIRKQYEGGHTCMQQVVRKLHGRNDTQRMIMENILLDRNSGSNCTAICVNAESGHGKTSLLHALYNDQQLMDTFDKRIWIQLSDKLDKVMLFRKIVEVAMNDHCSIANLECLQEMVKEEIADKKFLLFLDDANIEDQQFWSTVLQVLNAGAKGSAVIMATRSSTVSTFKDVATHSYFLNPLTEEKNLMLLQQYAVVDTDIQNNPDLLMVAQRFISRFGGNQLNLKAIGGLLCHADSTSLEMDKFEGSAVPLRLCHDVLPIHLKKCLAFCSLFPEGYIFDKHHMVLQWIAHGCVSSAEGCKLEDIGVEYFNELLCRSFFQYSPVHNDRFVMHELMYKVVESVSRDKYFKSEDPTSSIPENILHLSLVSTQFRTIELMSRTEGLKDLQTFLVVQPEWHPYKISFPTLNLVGLDDLFLKFTSLETLNLSHTDTEELPGSIVGLRNLQYLSVSNTSIRTLPSELCSLSNLQTLEAKDCRFLTELPGDTKKLLKLRHLDVTKELDYVHLPHGIGHLTELLTLSVFHASGDSPRCSISELGNLHNLRGSLRLSGLESVKTGSNAQEANLKDKHHLKDLTLQWHDGGVNIDDEDEDEDIENVAEQVLESLQPHANLQELAIRGYEGRAFPAWMQMQVSSSLPNLRSLTLDGCCNSTQFPAIAHLPSLKYLSARKMYGVQRLITNNTHGATKFPSLELLNLWEMYGLEELFEASEGDCPRLQKVCISRCPDLKRLPCIPSVRELVLHCGRELPDIPELASLVSLKIEGFHGVESFSLPALPVLKKMEIRSCKELSSVDGLSALMTVQRLKIAGCPKLVLQTTDSSLLTT